MKRNLSILGTLAITIALLLQSGTALADGSDHFGPFPSVTTDGSSCGVDWAADMVDREFTVHDNGDGAFKVTEKFTNGIFTTLGTTSPGRCETSNHHGSTVASGITGSFQGFLTGTVSSSAYNPNGCSTIAAACSTTDGFLLAVFGPSGPATFTCHRGYADCSFNFEYDSNDQRLQYHHWQDKSDNHGGEQFIGDIATL